MDTFAAFLDLRKAFDSVQRDFLFYKLRKIGINGKLYFVIKKIYESPKACVRLRSSHCTEWFETPSGVKQGDCFSSTSFSIFINDMALNINS